MKTLPVVLGIIVVVIITGTTFAQVQIKEVPLTWQQASLSDGEELYLELCAACHGKSGLGDGPAAPALKNPVPDLTALAAQNDGIFPRKEVENSIAGKSRVVSHGTIDMPVWGQAFEDVRPDWKLFHRKALANQRIFNLTEYLATIQAE
ncbi:MAG: cytochrome c [Woeseiaceae bacterium]|jgi:mono/diheme cytochrome c family protein|nr:cytochrome c [Woeseiaceae bacterium]